MTFSSCYVLKYIFSSLIIIILASLCLYNHSSTVERNIPPPDSTLPYPRNLTLRSIGLGIGRQIYKCSGKRSIWPDPQGSHGILYDIGTLARSENISEWRIDYMKTLSGDVLQMTSRPVLLNTYLALHGYNRVIGEYQETLNGTFQFQFKSNRIEGNVREVAAAPSNSFSGMESEGAIAWLYIEPVRGLLDSKAHAVSAIYRYYTAGGQPPHPCTSITKVFSVPYAAQYWIYKERKQRETLAKIEL